MNVQRNALLASTAYGHGSTLAPTTRERLAGRLMRLPDEPAAGTGGDNTGGNAGAPASGESTPNNDGQGLDLSSFWAGSDGGDGSSSRAGESTGEKTPPSGQQGKEGTQQQQAPADPGAALVAQIKGLTSAKGVMTEAAIAELGEGKTDAFHAQLDQFGQHIASQVLQMSVGIMGQLREQMRGEMNQLMEGTLNKRDSSADLLAAIPSAADPAVRPTVDRIFDRAMQHTKGDRKAAIDMTKDMLRLTFDKTGDDIGRPPRNANDGQSLIPSNTDWLAELNGR